MSFGVNYRGIIRDENLQRCSSFVYLTTMVSCRLIFNDMVYNRH